MPKKYTPFNVSIKNESDVEAVIDIDDYIGNEWTDSTVTRKALRRKLSELKELNANVEKIRVNISTYGGDVADGLAMYDILKEMDAEVTTVIRGLTASAGTIIAQAATPGKRLQSDNSSQLVHAAWTFTYGNAEDLRAEADDLDRITDRIVNIYVKNGANRDKVLEIMSQRDRWMLPEEALEMGLIDEIYIPEDKQEKDTDASALKKAVSNVMERVPFNAPDMEVTMKSNGDVVYKLLKNQEPEEVQNSHDEDPIDINDSDQEENPTKPEVSKQNNQGEEQPHNLELYHAHAIARSRKYKNIEVQ